MLLLQISAAHAICVCSRASRFLLQFNWDVEGIEDAEDDFENDLDLDADADADAALDVAAGASKAADFDKELAEFENAFD